MEEEKHKPEPSDEMKWLKAQIEKLERTRVPVQTGNRVDIWCIAEPVGPREFNVVIAVDKTSRRTVFRNLCRTSLPTEACVLELLKVLKNLKDRGLLSITIKSNLPDFVGVWNTRLERFVQGLALAPSSLWHRLDVASAKFRSFRIEHVMPDQVREARLDKNFSRALEEKHRPIAVPASRARSGNG